MPPTSTWFPRPGGLSLLSHERSAYRATVETASASEEPDPETTRKDSERRKTLLETALDRFTVIVESDSSQREREAEDLRFARALPEDQWPMDIRKARQGGLGPDGKTVSERPCLVIDKLSQPVQQVVAEARQARLGIEVKPKGNGANPEGAELRQGMIRAIEVDSNATNARLWALERAIKAGRGYYRVLTEYANDGDFDLDIRVARIENGGCVYLDPFATHADWSDMEYAFITDDMPADEYKRKYPKTKLGAASAEELESVTDTPPGWLESDVIRVAEYFYVEHEEKTLLFDPESGFKAFEDEWPKDIPIPPGVKRRAVDQRRVKWALINAAEVIEEQDWPGRYIPIVFVPGREDVVDGERCFRGMVGPAKDSQRSYNYMRSAQVEAVGLAPKAPWLIAEGQVEGYEPMWDAANVRNFPYLLYKPATFEGNPVPPPQRNVAEPAIQAISMAVREAESDIKATTGRFDPSLGQLSGERSGKAIEALKIQGEMSSSIYLDNLAQIAMMHEARILIDLMPKIYDRPGRVVRLLGDSPEDEKHVMLGQPFVPGPNGLPMPAQMGPQGPMGPGMPMGPMGPMGMARPMPGPPPPPPREYRLDPSEDYMVQVTIGRAYATERQANLQFLETMLEATKGQAAPLIMDLWAEQLGGPIGRKMAERFRASNPALSGENAQNLSPYAQAQLTTMQQQMQQMQQVLQEQQREIETQTAKARVDLEIAQREIASKEKIAQLQAEVELAKIRAQITAKDALQSGEFVGKAGLEQVKGVERRKDIVLEATVQTEQGAIEGEREDGREERRLSRETEVERERMARESDFEREKMDREEIREERSAEREMALERERMAREEAREERGATREDRRAAWQTGLEHGRSETEAKREDRRADRDWTRERERMKFEAAQKAKAKPKES